MQSFWVSSNDHKPYKYLCWTCLALQTILGNLQKIWGTQVEEQVAAQQSYSPKEQRTCWECRHCTVSWTWKGRLLLIRVLSKYSCVSCGMFRMSIIWISPARQGKLSETIFILELHWALKMDNQVFSPCKRFLLLRIQRYADIYQPLMCICPWDLAAD